MSSAIGSKPIKKIATVQKNVLVICYTVINQGGTHMRRYVFTHGEVIARRLNRAEIRWHEKELGRFLYWREAPEYGEF